VIDLVCLLGVSQPLVSKHLRVLREVGAVEVRDEGRRRLYRLNGRYPGGRVRGDLDQGRVACTPARAEARRGEEYMVSSPYTNP
jgi:DNA-binding transcriptional ArsR family regulator